MNELNQLLLNFGQKKSFNYQDFYVTKSNFYAFKLIEQWPKWEKNILNIYGEKYSGKTHLINIFLQSKKGLKINEKDLNDDKLKDIKIYEIIILEDFKNEVDERLLYSLFNLVDQDKKYLIINSLTPINKFTFNLVDLQSRSKNCLFAEIEKPDEELIFAIILKLFSDRQIKLDKKIIDFIIKRIDRSYRKIYEFIYKIDELSLKKGKPINQKTIKEIL